MKTLIKWPGGKSSEVDKIRNIIPNYDRYIEPFFGGGAVFFALEPEKAIINDVSTSLIKFYKLVKTQDKELKKYLDAYADSMLSIITNAEDNYNFIYKCYSEENNSVEEISKLVDLITNNVDKLKEICLDTSKFKRIVFENVRDKIRRTRRNNEKLPFSEEDLKENLITGFTSGYYMYFRGVFNDILLKRIEVTDAYEVANFYYIREYCYGSMFRYNRNGEFNIPYGGITYNRKSFKNKINNIFNSDVKNVFGNTQIYCSDFEKLLTEEIEVTDKDFMFLDPPYDTEFSDYEGKTFDRNDQKRLADTLKKTKAQFILIIKNTDYIYSLYKDSFRILTFDKNYTYNVRSRNDRNVEHLIITNIPE